MHNKLHKLVGLRMDQLHLLASASSCPRNKVAAMIVDEDFSIIRDAYCGPPKKQPGNLCGGNVCLRKGILSGTRTEVGCYHAEKNAILFAAREGQRLEGKYLISTHRPCLSCAKDIYHAGIVKVFTVDGSYSSNEGVEFLTALGVEVILLKDEEDMPF